MICHLSGRSSLFKQKYHSGFPRRAKQSLPPPGKLILYLKK
ncbi:Uncharacterized protein dnm_001070 [Desulfonema magnum]|uniref:Uncharacterized protein n=1 Tax=Desulfonema magnum TaxID=45655 RepID=A0A975BFA5_9BACT|nr:Uncharacterized protein dnm_001070 [Desulfonema magnum]